MKNFKDIKKALGKKGRKVAGLHFNDNWDNQLGLSFNQTVRDACQKGLESIGSSDEIVAFLNGNTADSLGHWIDG